MLKVSSPQPQVQEPQPEPVPMQEPPMQGEDPMNGGVPSMETDGMPLTGDEPNPYEADFDAGVDADEKNDPKRFIQQLTGKLSQSLRSYNEQLPQPDADLNKYVAGMIVKQATDGLSQEDVTEILDKVKNDEEIEEPSNGEENNQGANPQEQNAPQEEPQQQGPMSNEGLCRNKRNSQISELYKEFTDCKDDGSHLSPGQRQQGGYQSKPLTPPRFK